MKKNNTILNGLKNIIIKIWDGFLEHIGAAIAVALGAFIGTYFSNQNASKEIFDKLSKNDSIYFIVNEESHFALAKEYELSGFQALVNRDLEEAIRCFTKSENSANKYHASYEIAKYLIDNKKSVMNPNFWERTYKYVIDNYSGYIPLEIVEKMKESFQPNDIDRPI